VDVVLSPPVTQVSEGMLPDVEILEDPPEGEEELLGDDPHFLGDEDEIRTRQKLNSVATITSLRFQPISSSRFGIPLCRMLAMPMVRPTLSSDLGKLEQEFVHGYREGASVFYVTTTNEDGKTQEVTEFDKLSWGPIWDAKNDVFNSFLLSDLNLAGLTNLMFFVCDGNHRRQAWLNHIERVHQTDEDWHYLVDSILLDTKGKNGLVMQVMHDINK
jgi:hypothetical protein